MRLVRLTRACKKEQTRERLLDAARRSFIERGLAATSVEHIAEAAGYTRGAFYSNFSSQLELLLELLQRDVEKTCADWQAIIKSPGAPDQEKGRALARLSCAEFDNDCFPLWVEAGLLSSRDSTVRERVTGLRQKKLAKLAACLCAGARPGDGGWPAQPEALAAALLSLCDGMRFFRLCNPEGMTDDSIRAILAALFSCTSSGPVLENLESLDDAGATVRFHVRS
ncbi:TetR/AcrR family transcriptional regulator [Paraburkholderia sp. BR10923]|uniref:TetR/AcrR family transcriptional regulator n=1 Tax=Paraburkholderia sp. BR10923 TaxID=3236992 RepID=UPI0034CEF695